MEKKSKTKKVIIISIILIIACIFCILLVNHFIPMIRANIIKDNVDKNLQKIENVKDLTNIGEKSLKIGNKQVNYKYVKNMEQYYNNRAYDYASNTYYTYDSYTYDDIFVFVKIEKDIANQIYNAKDTLKYFEYQNKKFYYQVGENIIIIYYVFDNNCYVVRVDGRKDNKSGILNLNDENLSIIKTFLNFNIQ